MLHHLTIRNFALATDLALDFLPGFTVLTGETGAGKSLLLDALQACLGERLEGNPVRFGHQRADLTATFTIAHLPEVSAWLAERELIDEEDPQSVRLRRVISQENKSRAWINGVPAALGDLRELAEWLVQINSQHSQQRLLRSEFAREWLDMAAGLTEQAHQVRQLYRSWQAAARQYEQAQAQEANLAERQALLQFQLEELEPLKGLDYVTLEQTHDRLSHHESLTQDAGQILAVLDEQDSLIDQTGRLLKIAEQQAGRASAFAETSDHLMQVQSLLQETRRTLQRFVDTQELDPAQLAEIDEQLREFNRLARKYRQAPEDLIAQSEQWQQELTQLAVLADTAALAQQQAAAWTTFEHASRQLDQAREQAATALAEQVAAQLKPLALPEASVQFDFKPYDSPSGEGGKQVQLLFGANRGLPLQPVAKVASGGELSRLALVLQVLIAQRTSAPLLVFDEVDIGIGGSTAEVVGRLLRQLGQRVQVICITHQPQVAAQGHQHLLVQKQHGEQTVSTIMQLDNDKRVQELARMSGGVDITETTLEHARELLQAAGRANEANTAASPRKRKRST